MISCEDIGYECGMGAALGMGCDVGVVMVDSVAADEDLKEENALRKFEGRGGLCLRVYLRCFK